MSQEKPPIPSNKKIEYIIDYTVAATTPSVVRLLKDALAEFTPVYLTRVPYASVIVAHEQEQSLLETLATIPSITYRRGQSRHALDRSKEDSL